METDLKSRVEALIKYLVDNFPREFLKVCEEMMPPPQEEPKYENIGWDSDV